MRSQKTLMTKKYTEISEVYGYLPSTEKTLGTLPRYVIQSVSKDFLVFAQSESLGDVSEVLLFFKNRGLKSIDSKSFH